MRRERGLDVVHACNPLDLLFLIGGFFKLFCGNQRFSPSEANAVIDQFNRLDDRAKQDLFNFLRSL